MRIWHPMQLVSLVVHLGWRFCSSCLIRGGLQVLTVTGPGASVLRNLRLAFGHWSTDRDHLVRAVDFDSLASCMQAARTTAHLSARPDIYRPGIPQHRRPRHELQCRSHLIDREAMPMGREYRSSLCGKD